MPWLDILVGEITPDPIDQSVGAGSVEFGGPNREGAGFGLGSPGHNAMLPAKSRNTSLTTIPTIMLSLADEKAIAAR